MAQATIDRENASLEVPDDWWEVVARHLWIHVEACDGRVDVRLRGELDAAGAPSLRCQLDAVVRLGAHEVVVDLGDVDFIDSAGVQVLRDVAAASRRNDSVLSVWRGSPAVWRILEILPLEPRAHGRRSNRLG